MAIKLLHILLLLISITGTAQSAEKYSISLPGCPDSCGGIPIPYPFGIGDRCSLGEGFNVSCEPNSNDKPTPTVYGFAHEIVNISILFGLAHLNIPVIYRCYNTTTKRENTNEIDGWFWEPWPPYLINNEKNRFVVIGCNTFATVTLGNSTDDSVGCLSTCDSKATLNKYESSCSGIGCCQTSLPLTGPLFDIAFDDRYNQTQVHNFSPCSYAMVVANDHFQFDTDYATSYKLVNESMPVIFDWVIGNRDIGSKTCEAALTNKSSYACKSDHSVCLDYKNGPGYQCNCSHGYEGNPYLEGGCRDIDECAESQNPCSGQAKCRNLPGTFECITPKCGFGRHIKSKDTCQLNLGTVIGCFATFVALLFLGIAIYITLERRNISKLKEKYFQEHGGWILLEKIKSNQGFGFIIFTKQQVEQATNNFDGANIIGHGGHGTVYKGILRDKTVAIKKCKIVDESKKKEFGKEMLILSQISHKNIVKLLGCCLEVEVPMLVYEFIPNGSLHQYIHHKKSMSCMPLTTRLRIAYESAEALAYLHTSASPPIFHGDVKSANILLDQNYTAKVSDFGASTLAPTNGEGQLVTFVQGTLGYLDPEYMQTNRLTNKSDVYSYGVVLLELLTSKPVIDFDAPEEERGLSSRFLSAMKENKMLGLIDDEIKDENDLELIREIAELAKECLSMKGDERPTMKEVAEELYRISRLRQHPWEQENNFQETMIFLGEGPHSGIEIEHTSYSFIVDKEDEESLAFGR